MNLEDSEGSDGADALGFGRLSDGEHNGLGLIDEDSCLDEDDDDDSLGDTDDKATGNSLVDCPIHISNHYDSMDE
jgi:hypothetical protein